MASSLEYDLSPPDQDAFLVHHAKHAPYIVASNRNMRIIWSCAMLIVALGLWSESPVFGLGFLGVAAAFIVLYGPLNAWCYVRYNRQLNASPMLK